MRFISSRFLLALTACLIVYSAGGLSWAGRYYQDSDRPGFYWGKDPVDEEKAQEEKAEKDEAPKKKKHRIPSMSDYSPQKLWNMHPDDFQELADDFRKKAVQYPTEDNIKDYYYVQDIARRKALAFTSVHQVVMQKNPSISLESAYPTATPGRVARDQEHIAEYGRLIGQNRDSFGLVYFYQDGCKFCLEQDRILQYFAQKWGWNIKPVNIAQNPALARKFNVTTTPMTVLVKRETGEPMPLTTGVVALNEIEKRVYGGIRMLNREITAEQYLLLETEKGGAFDATAPIR